MKIVLKCVSSEKQSQIWPVPDGHRGQRQTATCTHTSQGINDKCRTSSPHLRAQPPLAPVGLSSCKVFDEDLTCQSRNPCWGVTWPELPTPTPTTTLCVTALLCDLWLGDERKHCGQVDTKVAAQKMKIPRHEKMSDWLLTCVTLDLDLEERFKSPDVNKHHLNSITNLMKYRLNIWINLYVFTSTWSFRGTSQQSHDSMLFQHRALNYH